MTGISRFGVNQHLSIEVYRDADAASSAGYNYTVWGTPPKALNIEKAVIVRKGTVGGNGTVDLVLVDGEGNRYVTMITAALLKTLPLD